MGVSTQLTSVELSLLTLLIFGAAFLYSSVGHAGASGYLAAMALFGLAPDAMKPTVLILNILVAAIATFRFAQVGCFSWRTLWPFAIGALPLAFIGGAAELPARSYKVVVGLVLLFAAWRMSFSKPRSEKTGEIKQVPILPGILWGAGIGFLAGLTGTGGGIFLSPLIVLLGWSETRKSGGVAAAFILINSIAGLGGRFTTSATLPLNPIPLIIAAVSGGLLGATCGTQKYSLHKFRLALAVVLAIAGCKLIFT